MNKSVLLPNHMHTERPPNDPTSMDAALWDVELEGAITEAISDCLRILALGSCPPKYATWPSRLIGDVIS